jgi:hypothetical protein
VGGVDGAGLDADFDGALFCVLGLRSPHTSMSASPPMTREATLAGRLRNTRREPRGGNFMTKMAWTWFGRMSQTSAVRFASPLV